MNLEKNFRKILEKKKKKKIYKKFETNFEPLIEWFNQIR